MSTLSDVVPLVELSASALAGKIAAGALKATDAVDACIARIEATHAEINAVSQPLYEEARIAAREADARQASGGSLGPLHGVPVSIKDCFAVRGTPITLGIPGYGEEVSKADAPLVARLRSAGAIVLGKTNVPQAMLVHECANPVFGCTALPGRPERSAGGSTGGEAALVAAGGSPLGLGSDLGGSIRQPAAACGVFGFKPSPGRLSIEGTQRALSRGMQAIAIQPGPMTRSFDDLLLGLRVLHDGDPSWPNLEAVDVSRLRIASWGDDGFFTPAAGLQRVVRESAAKLRDAGASVVELPADAMRELNIGEMFRIYVGLVSADGLASVRQLTSGGPVDPQLARQLRLARLPRWSRSLVAPVLRAIAQPELAELLTWSGGRSASSYWNLIVEAEQYRRTFWGQLAELAGGAVDAVVSPPFGLPALRHGTALHLLRSASHTFLANMLGSPAGVVPAGLISEQDEAEELARRPTGKWNVTNRFARENAEGSAGLPAAVEVLASPGADEKALAVMRAISLAP